jgi:putative transposase
MTWATIRALRQPGLPELAGELATAALREAIASGYRDQVHGLPGGQVPLLLAMSDNGRQMRSVTTRGSWPGWRSPGSSAGQAWMETLFGHVKGEWPHLEKIRDPGELDRSRPSTTR